jgi:hypothetical protein
MAVGAHGLGGWLGLAAFVALVVVLTWKAKGLSLLDRFGTVVQPMFVLFIVAAFVWGALMSRPQPLP